MSRIFDKATGKRTDNSEQRKEFPPLLPVLCYLFCGDKPYTNYRTFGTQFENGISIYTPVGGTVRRTSVRRADNRLKADITVFTRLKRRCRQKERFL